MIIECHDFLNPQTTKILKQRFSGSHVIDDVFEGSRDPNQFVSLRDLGFVRSLACHQRAPPDDNELAGLLGAQRHPMTSLINLFERLPAQSLNHRGLWKLNH
jgi:hypothetical protein